MRTVILVAAGERVFIIPGPQMPVDRTRPAKRGKPEKVYLTVRNVRLATINRHYRMGARARARY
jgi:hypothetical protein